MIEKFMVVVDDGVLKYGWFNTEGDRAMDRFGDANIIDEPEIIKDIPDGTVLEFDGDSSFHEWLEEQRERAERERREREQKEREWHDSRHL